MICCKYGTHKHSGLKVEATIHHMLESHHCPFGTAEAPHGFNRAKIQYRVKHTHTPARAHTHTHTHIHTNPHSSFKAAFNSGYISCLYKRKKIHWSFTPFSANDLLCIFPPALFSSFWGKSETLHSLNRWRKSRDLVRLSWEKKIEAGGELNCMSRGSGCDDKAAAGK